MTKAVKFKPNRFTVMGAIALVAATVGLAAPIVQSQSPAVVKVDGSSTVFPITEKVAEAFQKQGGAKVTVGISGTGGGFKKFCAGETDISNASRPILQKEVDACAKTGVKYIELPVAYDALTVVVNPSNAWATDITTAELKTMWSPDAQGKVKKWNQVRSSFPDAPLKLYGPGADSGTFDYFTEAINGKSKASRSDFTGSEDDNVLVQGVSRDKNALGYFGFAYYEANRSRLKAVKINGVEPSIANVDNGTYTPLSRPIYIYVNADAAKKPEVKAFVEYYMKNARANVSAVKYVPFKAADYTKAMTRFQKNEVGSVFGGKDQVGIKVADILSRQPK
ncbi:MAG TPA: PstS family phosphate ABC transporter substrate-binding protein [Crinalium sp.]